MIFLTLFIGLLTFLFYHFYWKRKDFPPGPTPLPLVGNLLAFRKYGNRPGYGVFEEWRKQFGPVYTYWMGTDPFVVFSDYQTMKEAFVKNGDVYTDKYYLEESNKIFRGGEYGIIDTSGDVWRENRRFALHQLRDFGLGKDLMQSKILIEVEEMTKKLNEVVGKDINIQEYWDVAVGSVINQFLFGYRFSDDKLEEFQELKSMLASQMRESISPFNAFCLMIGWTRYFEFGKNVRKIFANYHDKLWAFFTRQVKAHREEIDFDADENTDFVEAFLKEQRKRQQEGDTDSFSEDHLMNILVDLWIAGMETTSNTLTWAVVYLLNYPQVQARIQEELQSVTGGDREVTVSDKNDLVYLNAFINETQRMANLLPMNLPHRVTRQTIINGYTLQAGTGVIAQICTVLFDEKVFPEPMKFDPTRFIDEKGGLKKVEELVPFSLGKRQCLGEGLARMELFVFIANLLNKFTLKPSGNGLPSLEKIAGITVQVEPFMCRVERRSK